MSDLRAWFKAQAPIAVQKDMEIMEREISEGRRPDPDLLDDTLRIAAIHGVPLTPEITTYVRQWLPGARGRPPQSKLVRGLVNWLLRRSVDKRHRRYRRIRMGRPTTKGNWPKLLQRHLRWRRSGDQYKIEKPRELAIQVTAYRHRISPSYLRDRIKNVRRQKRGGKTA
jgi:hypothetical protein